MLDYDEDLLPIRSNFTNELCYTCGYSHSTEFRCEETIRKEDDMKIKLSKEATDEVRRLNEIYEHAKNFEPEYETRVGALLPYGGQVGSSPNTSPPSPSDEDPISIAIDET